MLRGASRPVLLLERTAYGLRRTRIVIYCGWKASSLGRTKASARAWIDAFLFRVSAMLAAADKRMVINMEDIVPATTVSPASLSTLSGSIAYTAVSTSRRGAEILLTRPGLHHLERLGLHSFFIIQGKPVNLAEGVPQAVLELYTRGKFFKTKYLRGALTNGRDWIFLYLEFTDDSKTASYSESAVINWTTQMDLNGEREVDKPWPEVIAAILADWVENSYSSIDSDNWFEPV